MNELITFVLVSYLHFNYFHYKNVLLSLDIDNEYNTRIESEALQSFFGSFFLKLHIALKRYSAKHIVHYK
jgi:hypothetical protein